ncbi:MAG: hypothetical protein WBX20_02525, partial [Terrimicrobiaceae bacterium]
MFRSLGLFWVSLRNPGISVGQIGSIKPGSSLRALLTRVLTGDARRDPSSCADNMRLDSSPVSGTGASHRRQSRVATVAGILSW